MACRISRKTGKHPPACNPEEARGSAVQLRESRCGRDAWFRQAVASLLERRVPCSSQPHRCKYGHADTRTQSDRHICIEVNEHAFGRVASSSSLAVAVANYGFVLVSIRPQELDLLAERGSQSQAACTPPDACGTSGSRPLLPLESFDADAAEGL